MYRRTARNVQFLSVILPHALYFRFGNFQIGISIVYRQWDLLMEKYRVISETELNPAKKRDAQWVLNQLKIRWKKIYNPIHLESYVLDPRFIDVAHWMEGYGINEYLQNMQSKMPGADYAVFRREFIKFRGREGMYGQCMAGINARSDYKMTRDFWKELKVRCNGTGPQMALYVRGWRSVKISPGSVSCENSFRVVTLIHSENRRGLGYEKLKKLVFIYVNYRLLKERRSQ